jgi:hypothetical protein
MTQSGSPMKSESINYRQDPRFGRETFELEKDLLVVSVHAIGLSKIERFKVSDIDRLDKRSERVPAFTWVSLGYMILATGSGAYLLKDGSLFSYAAVAVLFYAALLFAFRGVKGMKGNEVVNVVNRDGETICNIWRPKDEELGFEVFISRLRSKLSDLDRSN